MAGPAQAAAPWRHFARRLAVCTLGALALAWGFVVLVDPWDTLPLSPPADRAPVSSNARFSFPALARSARFDAAIFGTSTSRLLRPEVLDAAIGARFANLAMNSATAYEQSRLFAVFARAHPRARAVILGLDDEWCDPGPLRRFTPRPFPEWLYGESRWPAYREMLTLYAMQEAGKQFGVLFGLTRARTGRDGYASFLPDDARYDAARARAHILAETPAMPPWPAGDPAALAFASHALLAGMLAALPAESRKLVAFLPYEIGFQGPPGSEKAVRTAECKRRVAAIVAASPGAVLLDFNIPSPITTDPTNYWDPHHYRIGIADRLMAHLALAARGQAVSGAEVIVAGGRP